VINNIYIFFIHYFLIYQSFNPCHCERSAAICFGISAW
jgi:hypothetical protein